MTIRCLSRQRSVDMSRSSVSAKSVPALARILLPILVVGYWAAGWAMGPNPLQWSFPFVLHENDVEKTLGAGFSFAERGIVYTDGAPSWTNAAIEDDAFQVELQVRPYSVHQDSAWIFTLSLDYYNRNFSIGQHDGSDLVIRLRTPATGSNGTPGYRIRNFFRDLASHRIVVRVEPEQMRIELDGRQLPIVSLPSEALSTWNRRYRLALGNEFTFDSAWQGAIDQAAVRVRDEEFSYLPTELRAPETYTIGVQPYVHKLIASVVDPFQHFSLRNLVVNVVGFLPFGFLLAFVARKPFSLPLAGAWCALMSLSIEVGQLFLGARHPSIVDLLLNTLGGCIGASIGRRMRIFSTKRWLST